MRRTNPFIDFILIAVGLFFIGDYLFKDKINSIADLQEVNGTVQDYSFVENRGFRSHTYNYYIFLNEYPNRFQIVADFIPDFNKANFEYSVRKGDFLKILIAKNENGQNQDIRLFGIKNRTTEFLSPENAIIDYNSKTILILGIVLSIVGLILLYYDINKRKKKHRNVNKYKQSNNLALKNKIKNDKIVFIENVNFDNLKSVIEDFCSIYNKDDLKVLLLLSRISEKSFIISFPHDIDFEIYCYFINYLYYPRKIRNFHPKINAWTTTKPSDKWVNGDIANKIVMFYIPTDDKEYDNVYLITSDSIVCKMDFGKGRTNKNLSEIKYNFVKPIKIEDFKLKDSIEFK